MKTLNRLLIPFVVAVVATLAALPAAAQNNNAPKPNIVGSNGLVAGQVLSTDPQISTCVFDATGVTVTSATLVAFADATHFPCLSLRGATVPTSSAGSQSIRRNGLYRVNVVGNCTGVTTETGKIAAQISVDGGVTWTAISGASAQTKFLTGTLQQNLAAMGYVTVSQTTSNLQAGNVLIELFGSSSGGSAMTCAAGGGAFVERVDQLQPATYP